MVYVWMRLSVGASLLSVGLTKQHPDLDIDAGEIRAILDLLSHQPYITQETVYGGGEPIQPSEYVINGAPLPVVGRMLKSDMSCFR